MPRPREFDEARVLDAAMNCFWSQGYEAASVRDLAGEMGITGASLYNAFGDKKSLYRRALDHYADRSVHDRIHRLESLPGHQAISSFFAEIVRRSLADRRHRGCLLVNAALEPAHDDPTLRRKVAQELTLIEEFFRGRVQAGQQDGTITTAQPADALAKLLLGTLLGIRVLARARPQAALLEGTAHAALSLLKVA